MHISDVCTIDLRNNNFEFYLENSKRSYLHYNCALYAILCKKKWLSSTAGILLINYQKSYDMHISDPCKINLQTNNFLFWRRSYLCIRRTLATCSPAHMTAIFNFNNCIFPLETPVKNCPKNEGIFFLYVLSKQQLCF